MRSDSSQFLQKIANDVVINAKYAKLSTLLASSMVSPSFVYTFLLSQITSLIWDAMCWHSSELACGMGYMPAYSVHLTCQWKKIRHVKNVKRITTKSKNTGCLSFSSTWPNAIQYAVVKVTPSPPLTVPSNTASSGRILEKIKCMPSLYQSVVHTCLFSTRVTNQPMKFSLAASRDTIIHLVSESLAACN